VDYLRGVETRVVPVGRLDYQTSGVLLLTNDGDFARELLHPSRGVLKEYVLKLKGAVDAAGLERLRARIDIGGKQTKPARVDRLRADDNNTWLLITLQEGKNRQVRRLAEYAGYRVMRLTRTRFAGLSTEGLRPGDWRQLSAAELRTVRSQSNTEPGTGDHPRPASGPKGHTARTPKGKGTARSGPRGARRRS
jgi:23S rRNA pseudouridine2605 synthase